MSFLHTISPSELPSASPSYTLWQMVRYMLRLGTLGFGGPVALVGYMYRDLVEQRRWISDADYKEGLSPPSWPSWSPSRSFCRHTRGSLLSVGRVQSLLRTTGVGQNDPPPLGGRPAAPSLKRSAAPARRRSAPGRLPTSNPFDLLTSSGQYHHDRERYSFTT